MKTILKPSRTRATHPQADLMDQHGRICRSPRALAAEACIVLSALSVLILSVQIALPVTPEHLDFFEQRIRPTLELELRGRMQRFPSFVDHFRDNFSAIQTKVAPQGMLTSPSVE